MAASKKQRLSLVDAMKSSESQPQTATQTSSNSTLVESDSAFNYNLIEDVAARKFLSEQAIEIRNLMVDSRRLYQKAGEILDQSTESLVEAGRSLQVAKNRLKEVNGHGHWRQWLVDEFSETFVEFGILQTDSTSPATVERRAQELMQLAQTLEQEPEHRELLRLNNVKPYLMTRLTASATPKEARAKVVEQIQQAEATGQPIPGTKAVRQTIAQYNPKASELRNKMLRSISAAPSTPRSGAESRSTRSPVSTPSTPPVAKPVEIVSVIPAASLADAGTATLEPENHAIAQAVPRTKVKPRHLYLCGKHVLFSGSPTDEQWLASLPRPTDSDGIALFELLTDYSDPSEPVVIQIGGQVFAACENLELLADIIDEWSAIAGKEAIEQAPRR